MTLLRRRGASTTSRSRGIVIAVVSVVTLSSPPAEAEGFTTITSPLQVPLHWRSADDDPTKPRKLGLYATTGGVTDVDKVAVQFSTLNPYYYLNTGILPFTQHDVIFNLAAGKLTLAAVPEPSSLGLAATGGLAALGWTMRRQRPWRR